MPTAQLLGTARKLQVQGAQISRHSSAASQGLHRKSSARCSSGAAPSSARVRRSDSTRLRSTTGRSVVRLFGHSVVIRPGQISLAYLGSSLGAQGGLFAQLFLDVVAEDGQGERGLVRGCLHHLAGTAYGVFKGAKRTRGERLKQSKVDATGMGCFGSGCSSSMFNQNRERIRGR